MALPSSWPVCALLFVWSCLHKVPFWRAALWPARSSVCIYSCNRFGFPISIRPCTPLFLILIFSSPLGYEMIDQQHCNHALSSFAPASCPSCSLGMGCTPWQGGATFLLCHRRALCCSFCQPSPGAAHLQDVSKAFIPAGLKYPRRGCCHHSPP